MKKIQVEANQNMDNSDTITGSDSEPKKKKPELLCTIYPYDKNHDLV